MPEADADALREKTALLGGYTTGALVAAMMSVGVRLGLYEALRGAGPSTSDTLAQATGYQERWLREWLRGQAAAGVLEYEGDGKFALPTASAALLADPTSLVSMEAMVASIPDRLALVPRVEESFRTGLGFSVDDRGAAAARGIDGLFANWHRQELLTSALPLLSGVEERLIAGAVVADVGCGSGVALVEMAKAFPRSEFHGFDVSQQMLTIARRNATQAGLANATFYHLRETSIPDDQRFALVMTFDCLHDMTNPHETASAIRSSLQPDGTWFIADIDSRPTFEENLRDNPRAAGSYAISVLACMASALSEPGGAGYGTLGLPEPVMRELVLEAGFNEFRRLELSGLGSAFYEARL